jgi:hypothetical protein
MRTTYVVLLLVILSTASSYGFELGVLGGVRDWKESSDTDTRITPMLAVTVGNRFSEHSWFRADALVGLWSREVRYFVYDYPAPFGNGLHDLTSDQTGFQIGGRATIDVQSMMDDRRPSVRPIASVGVMLVSEDAGPWTHDQEKLGAEFCVGLAIPAKPGADVLLLYNHLTMARGDDPAYGYNYISRYVTLGYRFSVR